MGVSLTGHRRETAAKQTVGITFDDKDKITQLLQVNLLFFRPKRRCDHTYTI